MVEIRSELILNPMDIGNRGMDGGWGWSAWVMQLWIYTGIEEAKEGPANGMCWL